MRMQEMTERRQDRVYMMECIYLGVGMSPCIFDNEFSEILTGVETIFEGKMMADL